MFQGVSIKSDQGTINMMTFLSFSRNNFWLYFNWIVDSSCYEQYSIANFNSLINLVVYLSAIKDLIFLYLFLLKISVYILFILNCNFENCLRHTKNLKNYLITQTLALLHSYAILSFSYLFFLYLFSSENTL